VAALFDETMNRRVGCLAVAALAVVAFVPGVAGREKAKWRDCGTVRVKRPLYGYVRENRVQARADVSCATARYIGRRFRFGGYNHHGLTCFYAGMGSGNPYWNWSCGRGTPGHRAGSLDRVRGHGPIKVKAAAAGCVHDLKRVVTQADDKQTVHLRVGQGIGVRAVGGPSVISVDPPGELDFIAIPTPTNALYLRALRPGIGTLTATRQCFGTQCKNADSFSVRVIVSW